MAPLEKIKQVNMITRGHNITRVTYKDGLIPHGNCITVQCDDSPTDPKCLELGLSKKAKVDEKVAYCSTSKEIVPKKQPFGALSISAGCACLPGDGLILTDDTFSVGEGTRIIVSGSLVNVDVVGLAGLGLTVSSDALNVDLVGIAGSGLSVVSNTLNVLIQDALDVDSPLINGGSLVWNSGLMKFQTIVSPPPPANTINLTNDNAGNLVAGDFVYISSSNGCDKALGTSLGAAQAIGLSTGTILPGASGPIQTDGLFIGFVGLTVGARYYLSSTTAGAITATPPSTPGSYVLKVGYAVSSTSLLLRFSDPILI